MLRFIVEEIPDGGLELTEVLDEEWVRPLLAPQFSSEGCKLRLEVFLKKTRRNVAVKGRLLGTLTFVCAKCLSSSEYKVDLGFTHVFVTRAHHGALPTDLQEEEGFFEQADFTYYDGKVVELEPVVAEEFVLSQPWFPVCREDCKGLCQRCGQNLNEGQCGCEVEAVDPRWARLKEIKL